MSNSFKTCDNRQNTCIHVNTLVPTGSEMVPCLLGNTDTVFASRMIRITISQWSVDSVLGTSAHNMFSQYLQVVSCNLLAIAWAKSMFSEAEPGELY